MDIDLLSKIVKELILDNDTVALPGLGTFVAELVPASFSDKGYTINPPYRKLHFSGRLDDNDTKIADFYAKSNLMDKTAAEKIISDFFMEMKEVLIMKKVIVFPGLGKLRATKENDFFFVPDEDLDIYPDGFGLQPVSLKTHEKVSVPVSADLSDSITDFKEDKKMINMKKEKTNLSEELEAEKEQQLDELEENQEDEECQDECELGTSSNLKMKTLVVVLLVIACVIMLLLIAFLIMNHFAPDFVNSLLYTEEELQLLKY